MTSKLAMTDHSAGGFPLNEVWMGLLPRILLLPCSGWLRPSPQHATSHRRPARILETEGDRWTTHTHTIGFSISSF